MTADRPALSPVCPVCGHPPFLVLNDEQAFCGNDECRALMWNPSRTAAQNLAGEREVRLTRNDAPVDPAP